MDIIGHCKSGRKGGQYSHRNGHTMRRQDYSGDKETFTGQFTICKRVVVNDEVFSQEEDVKAVSEEFANYVDDGGLEADIFCNVGSDESEESGSEKSEDKFEIDEVTGDRRKKVKQKKGWIGRDSGIVYSQNKRRRWLLAEQLQDNLGFKVILEERELIMSSGCPRRKGRPDCMRVYESKTDQLEKLPNHKYSFAKDLRKKGEQPAAPRQRNQQEEDPPPEPEPKMTELYYEMCYARPDDNSPWKIGSILYPRRDLHKKGKRPAAHRRRNWEEEDSPPKPWWFEDETKIYNRTLYYKPNFYTPWKKRASGRSRPIYSRRVNGVRLARRANSQTTKWYDNSDSDSWAQDVQDSWDDEEHTELQPESEQYTAPCSSSSNLGDVTAHLLKQSDKVSKIKRRGKKVGQKSCCGYSISPNQAFSSNQVKVHGKGATIYEEKEESLDINLDAPEEEPISSDVHVTVDNSIEQDIRLTSTLRISSHTIQPKHLANTRGSAYIESISQPRRFAVHVAQNLTRTKGYIYVLFEMIDDENSNNMSCNWRDTEGEWQNYDVDEYTNMRVSLIISPNSIALNESDFCAAMHAGIDEVHTVGEVVRWLTDMINDKMAAVNETNCVKKIPKYVVVMDTITKANGWKLKVDTPEGVYQEIQQKSKSICGICYESLLPADDGVGATSLNACGHCFCNECWTQHLRSRVKQRDLNITCPAYECKSAIDIVTKMSLMSTSDFFHHLAHMRDAAITRKAEWQWCPNPKCGRMACVVAGAGAVAVNCACGWLWCSQCMQDAHWPATCKQAAGYRKLVKGMESKGKSAPIISIEVKQCLGCNYPIQKMEEPGCGCLWMWCTMCGYHFCWRCLWECDAHFYIGSWTRRLRCPKPMVQPKPLFLEEDTKVNYSSMQFAVHHRGLRIKSIMEQYQTNVYRLTAKEFLKKSTPAYLKSTSPVLSNGLLHCMIQEEDAKNLPITWASTETILAALLEKSSMGQECAQFRLEAHFVLEFLAIYLSDKTLKKKHRKQFDIVSNRLEFITKRLDEVLSSRSNLSQARLLTQAGKSCLEKLVRKMKNAQNVETAN